MGGTPVSALNIVAFPLEQLGADVLAAILRGGLDVVREAGAMLVGGHSIADDEPKYGLAVTGTVDPARVLTQRRRPRGRRARADQAARRRRDRHRAQARRGRTTRCCSARSTRWSR